MISINTKTNSVEIGLVNAKEHINNKSKQYLENNFLKNYFRNLKFSSVCSLVIKLSPRNCRCGLTLG